MKSTYSGNEIHSIRKVSVGRGLFILRYAASKAGLNAPIISVVASDDSSVEIFSPSSESAQLVCPGDGLVIRAARDSTIDVSVSPLHAGGSRDAELVLERIHTTIPLPSLASASQDDSAMPTTEDIQILAHVARRGDILVPAGEWICGPDLPMVIEGIEIRWPNRPDGIDIVTRATVNTRNPQTLPEKAIGSFQGTRGRAAAITSLTLALAGPRTKTLALSCEALFLGQSVLHAQGSSCIVAGATGREPLVGLRLSVNSVAAQSAHAISAKPTYSSLPQPTAALPIPPPRAASSPQLGRNNRVRVFRSPNQRTSSLSINS